jgi:hypothetical protein
MSSEPPPADIAPRAHCTCSSPTDGPLHRVMWVGGLTPQTTPGAGPALQRRVTRQPQAARTKVDAILYLACRLWKSHLKILDCRMNGTQRSPQPTVLHRPGSFYHFHLDHGAFAFEKTRYCQDIGALVLLNPSLPRQKSEEMPRLQLLVVVPGSSKAFVSARGRV